MPCHVFLSLQKYELKVTASDSFKENYTTVVINIRGKCLKSKFKEHLTQETCSPLDVNDNSPIFEKTSYRTQITEEDDRALPKRVLKVIN